MKKLDKWAEKRHRRTSKTKELILNITDKVRTSANFKKHKEHSLSRRSDLTPSKSIKGSSGRASPIVVTYRKLTEKNIKDLTSQPLSCRSMDFTKLLGSGKHKGKLFEKILKKRDQLSSRGTENNDGAEKVITPLESNNPSTVHTEDFETKIRIKTPKFNSNLKSQSGNITPLMVSSPSIKLFAKKKKRNEEKICKERFKNSLKNLRSLSKNSSSREVKGKRNLEQRGWEVMNHNGKVSAYKSLRARRYSDGQSFTQFKSIRKELFNKPPKLLSSRNTSRSSKNMAKEMKKHVKGAKQKLKNLKSKNQKIMKKHNIIPRPRMGSDSSSQDTVVLQHKKDEEILLLKKQNTVLTTQVSQLKEELVSIRKHLTNFLVNKNTEIEKLTKKVDEMHRDNSQMAIQQNNLLKKYLASREECRKLKKLMLHYPSQASIIEQSSKESSLVVMSNFLMEEVKKGNEKLVDFTKNSGVMEENKKVGNIGCTTPINSSLAMSNKEARKSGSDGGSGVEKNADFSKIKKDDRIEYSSFIEEQLGLEGDGEEEQKMPRMARNSGLGMVIGAGSLKGCEEKEYFRLK
jgi:phosphoribosylanthranilate isomerase